MNGRRILIVLFGAIGDVTQALPLAMRIKRAEPASRLTWAVEPASAGLVTGHPAVDRVVRFERSRGFKGYREFIRELRAEQYDLVLDLQRHFKSGVTSFLSRGETRYGFHPLNAKEFNWLFNKRHIPRRDDGSPKIRHYQAFGDALGLPPTEPLEYGLNAGEAERQKVAALLEEEARVRGVALPAALAAFVCGASWETKRWPVEHSRELVRRLWEEEKIICVLVGGKDEAGFGAAFDGGGFPFLDLTGKTSLRELCAVFERCRFVVGADTGPSHIAAACGKPVVTLWGPTNPKRSAPYGSESLVLQSAVGCAPCYRRRCPGLDTMCMSDIVPEAVLARIGEVTAHGS